MNSGQYFVLIEFSRILCPFRLRIDKRVWQIGHTVKIVSTFLEHHFRVTRSSVICAASGLFFECVMLACNVNTRRVNLADHNLANIVYVVAVQYRKCLLF